ncbi:MAG: hypothetical protein IPM50_03840 [Acidobacteriota bacterium]|nr:MAG: hypothetical protein IPM50_03840 [Acidobacteriota bacterium]
MTKYFAAAAFILFSLVFAERSAVAQSERAIAERFAPVFYQALGSSPRSDYITNFDFDGDWRGDNNWANTDDPNFKLRAYIYYSVSETTTHYFVHYAVFHPRDYKGGARRGTAVSGLLGRAANVVGRRDPTGLLDMATLAHENDLEGVLVVAEKGSGLSSSQPILLETLKHNTFVSYTLGGKKIEGLPTASLDGNSAVIYVEPLGHGIDAFLGTPDQIDGKDFVIYRFTGRAEDPEDVKEGPVGYELIRIADTLWPRANPRHRNSKLMYGEFFDYGEVVITMSAVGGRNIDRRVRLGRRGSAFLGRVGGADKARPPWGWFDRRRRGDDLGTWFFDPAKIIKRNFALDDSFSTAYVNIPFWAQ